MSRETNYQAVILKKQPYGEGDEILTFYTQEAGKVRALAKSSKFAKSKLQYGLQTLFLVNISLAGSALPKIIGVEVINPFAKLRASFAAAKISFYALELVLKFTPDEHKNENLFNLLAAFFGFLDAAASQEPILQVGLAKFKIEFLESLGLAIHYPSNVTRTERIGFSNSRGGFLIDQNAVDFHPASLAVFSQFLDLKKANFEELAGGKPLKHNLIGDLIELQALLSDFLTYQLEREIKSEKYLEL